MIQKLRQSSLWKFWRHDIGRAIASLLLCFVFGSENWFWLPLISLFTELAEAVDDGGATQDNVFDVGATMFGFPLWLYNPDAPLPAAAALLAIACILLLTWRGRRPKANDESSSPMLWRW